MHKLINFIKSHQLAFVFAFLVGIIYLAPYIFFIVSLGENYRDIPIMRTANEDYYLGRMQEIMDGHPTASSFVFYEYKDQWPLMPPTGEMFYALPSILFGISLVNILIASKFILPFILFLLIYFLIRRLTEFSNFLSNKINAIAGALLVTLGYDLVGYRELWFYIIGEKEPVNFLIWARPVNPILGAVFLFSFLLFIWAILQKTKYSKTAIIGAAITLALMITSYFFSWGVALSVWGVLILIYLFYKEYNITKNLLWVALLSILLTMPYWYISWQASQSLWYQESLLRNGIFYTHYPLINKVLLATIIFYLILFIPSFFKKSVLILKNKLSFKSQFNLSCLKTWQLFCLSLLIGGLWALNQQVVTGVTIWPFHFVQYTIPFAMIVVCVLFYNIIRKKWPYLWSVMIIVIIFSSLVFGVYVQVKVYKKNYDFFAELQPYKTIFNWLNQKEKDCVVFVKDNNNQKYNLDLLIPAFTHCNTYAFNYSPTIMPNERSRENYLLYLKFNEVPAKNIEGYLKENRGEASSYLFSNWKGVYGVKQFPDFSDQVLEDNIKQFPDDYRRFMKKDLIMELNKYRLDYILSEGPLSKKLMDELKNPELVFQENNFYIYNFN